MTNHSPANPSSRRLFFSGLGGASVLTLLVALASCTGGKTAAAGGSHTGVSAAKKGADTDASKSANKDAGNTGRLNRAPTIVAAPPKLRLPDRVSPTAYAVELTIDPDQPTFTGSVTIDIDIHKHAPVLWLNGKGLKIERARLTVGDTDYPLAKVTANSDGKSGQGPREAGIPARPATASGFIGFTGAEALMADAPTPLSAKLSIDYRGRFRTLGEGGFFTVKDRGESYVFSHLEPIDARTAIPCFDEPRFKVPWQMTLHVKKEHAAFFNTPLTGTRPSPKAGYIAHQFAASKPMPSYLLAIAVGPLEVVDLGPLGRARVPARVIVPKGRSADASYAKTTTPRILDWLEDYFDMPYPYAKLDQVAIPGQGGAMEHPGLITYGDRILLTDNGRRTDQFDSFHNMVVAHELAHQWFGNLVTLAWWNDLWLNESFATWMASKVRHRLQPAWDSDVHELRQLEWTKQTDSQMEARSLRRPIFSDADIEGAFDSISYRKGGAVLAMFERWVGEQAFRDGVRAYIRKHAWGITTSDDFLAALSETIDPAIADAFKTFLTQPGIPHLRAKLTCPKSGAPTLELKQTRFFAKPSDHANLTWRIPVCLRYGKGSRSHRQCQLVTGRSSTLTLNEGRGCPRWLLANAGSTGYYRVEYDGPLRESLLGKGFAKLSNLERLSLISDTLALALRGDIALDEVLQLVPKLALHKSPHVVTAAVTVVSSIKSDFVPDDLQAQYVRFVQRTFGKRARALGWLARPGEKSAISDLRDQVVPLVADAGRDRQLRAHAQRLIGAWLDRGGDYESAISGKVDRNLHLSLLSVGLADADDSLYTRAIAAFEAETHRHRRFMLGFALSETERPERLEAHRKKILDRQYSWPDAWPFVHTPMQNRSTRPAALDFAIDNFSTISEGLPERWRARAVSIFRGLCDDTVHTRVKVEVGPQLKGLPEGSSALAGTLNDIKACTIAQTRQRPLLRRFLQARAR